MKAFLLFLLLSYLFLIINPAHAATDIASNYAFGSVGTFGSLINYLIPVAFSMAAILVSFYIIVAAFDMIMSQGDKNATAAARDKIVHAIIGLMLLIAAFLVVRYLPYAIGLGATPATNIFIP